MDIRNCKRCGRVFQYKGKSICSDCMSQDDEDYKTIREYIHDHPDSSPLDISEHTKVELKTITRFLREGRLESEGIDTSDSGLQCEKCGRDIASGRYCDACLKELQNAFQTAARQMNGGTEVKPRESGQTGQSGQSMHTYENILNRKR